MTTKRIQFKQLLQLDGEWVRERIRAFLEEDIPNGDVTTLGTVQPDKKITAYLNSRTQATFAGAEVIPFCFPESCQIELLAKDRDRLIPGQTVAIIKGKAQDILSHERVMLNLVQRLCGIATLTSQYTAVAAPEGFMVLDTRKMTPGLRLFEKYAVAVGGGYNHRLNLSTGVLIKDNHLEAAGGVKEAIESVRKQVLDLPIELEVDNLEQLQTGLEMDVDGFLLDNMSPDEVKVAVNLVRNFPQGESIFLEASGGITLKTFPDYVWTGVDGISIGALTTQAQNIDLGLEFDSL